jgi:hypothetical protein
MATREVYLLAGHCSEIINGSNSTFELPNDCTVTVRAKCGDVSYDDTFIADFNNFLKTSTNKLKHPDRHKKYVDKTFSHVITYSPVKIKMCPNFKFNFLVYFPPKDPTNYILHQQILIFSNGWDHLLGSGLISHNLVNNKNIKIAVVVNLQSFIIHNTNTLTIVKEILAAKDIEQRDQLHEKLGDIFIDSLFGLNSILKDTRDFNYNATNNSILEVRKEHSYKKVREYIANYDKIKSALRIKIKEIFENAPEEVNIYNDIYWKIMIVIINLFMDLYNDRSIKLLDSEVEAVENLTMEDLCHCFPGDYYHFACRNIAGISNKINTRRHGQNFVHELNTSINTSLKTKKNEIIRRRLEESLLRDSRQLAFNNDEIYKYLKILSASDPVLKHHINAIAQAEHHIKEVKHNINKTTNKNLKKRKYEYLQKKYDEIKPYKYREILSKLPKQYRNDVLEAINRDRRSNATKRILTELADSSIKHSTKENLNRNRNKGLRYNQTMKELRKKIKSLRRTNNA